MSSRPNAVLAVVAGLVLALGVVAGVFTATRPAPEIDPTTPDGVVQLYTLAIIDGDTDKALTYLDPALGCNDPSLNLEFSQDRVNLSIVSTRIAGDTATVVADLSEYSGAFSSWEHRETFELRQIDGEWLLSSPSWPIYGCK